MSTTTIPTSSTSLEEEEDVLLPLSSEQIATYLKDGILVVDNLLTPQEVHDAQHGLVLTLQEEYGVNVHDLEGTGYRLMDASSTFGAGGVLDIFYPEWKMKIATNERLFRMTCQLWKEAYYHHNGEELKDDILSCCKKVYDADDGGDCNSYRDKDDDDSFKWHPFGSFDCNRGYMYIDRIGYRIPTSLAESIGKQQHQLKTKNNSTQQQIQHPTTSSTNSKSKNKNKKAKPIQRSLTPHFDCCPENYHDTSNKNKWRPIQCFVSLTDNLYPNTGGFEAVPGFHREFSSWVANGRKKKKTATTAEEQQQQQSNNKSHPLPCVGEYTHLSPSYDKELMERIEHIPVKAGSVVFWDNRIPHGNSYRNDSSVSRAVVYCSFLPDVDINRKFVQRQLVDWKEQRPPRIGDRWMKQEEDDVVDATQVNDTDKSSQPDENVEFESCYNLTDLGRRLIGMVSWIENNAT